MTPVTSADTNLTLCLPRPSSGLNPNSPVVVSTPKPTHVPDNHVLIKVDRFGFSANNVTYQALGESPHFKYFEFHPAPETDGVSAKTHGLVPVWGFGTVVASTHPKISVDERVYGYLAPCRYLLLPVSPSDVNKHAFYVPRPHLPEDRRPYNQIQRCASDPLYTPSSFFEDLTMLYRPLFWTSYWCEDWLSLSNYRNASSIIISSASSKTAFCLAYLIGKRQSREKSTTIKIIGLTSKGNLAFTKRLGLYTEVYDYDSFTSSDAFRGSMDEKWLYVDVAANAQLNKKMFDHFASPYTGTLTGCVVLGMTNLSPSSGEGSKVSWDANTLNDHAATTSSTPVPTSSTSLASASTSSPYPPPLENFFMVEWLQIRKHQLSVSEIFSRQQTAWTELMADCTKWVELERVYGGNGVKKAYEKVVGGLGPDKGFIWSLWDEQQEKYPVLGLARL